MSTPFKRIAIIAKHTKEPIMATVRSVYQLIQDLKLEATVASENPELITALNLPSTPTTELSPQTDLAIVVGGDGSLLAAAQFIVDQNIPVLGINRGRLGFLTDIKPEDIETRIPPILNGEYREEQRALLSTTVVDTEGQILFEGTALNEIALLPGSRPHMIEFEIYTDEHFVCSQRADGMVIATPTGSTAYALSGGGPILHPELNAITLVPMFPHSLTSRPIVMSADHAIRLVIGEGNETTPRISCDGQAPTEVPCKSEIKIARKPQSLRLIHPLDHSYYQALRSKLYWGKKIIN